MKVTLGGDRLGSGNKNKIALRNYERSTHNLDAKFTSSLQCGVLYPFSVIPATRGDSFTIDVNADARTVPTKGPLFGSFKMQIDYFQCPFRLYQAILHNNPLAIGLKMNQVKLPIIYPTSISKGSNEPIPFNNTSLLKYIGLSGLGTCSANSGTVKRGFNAIPILAYYDIFKTYYSNKQEQKAYVISATAEEYVVEGQHVMVNGNDLDHFQDKIDLTGNQELSIQITYDEAIDIKHALKQIVYAEDTEEQREHSFTLEELNKKSNEVFKKNAFEIYQDDALVIRIVFNTLQFKIACMLLDDGYQPNKIYFDENEITIKETSTLQLNGFELQNIDDMRLAILSKHELGTPFKIGIDQDDDWNVGSGTDHTGLPYSTLVDMVETNQSMNEFPLNGLVVKTYQSDLFNNWVRTEWIDGENGIAAITAISTSGGSFTIDTLNLSEKLYNMLNRVAVSDGSYEGWQDAVYTESPKRHIESPVYLGGSSNEIVFEEIVQTTPTDESPLGNLGGKGRLIKRKGGHINVKIDEASFIIGIVSLTPRINYTQGNEWYMTDLMSMDDLHKPALDGIGFQNLMAEQLAYWGTKFNASGTVTERTIIGKVPAWINYMTRVDKGYGDFAATDGNGFMLLQRNYEKGSGTKIKDATTYIDPQKYNYAFAYKGIDAQNFWVQIYENVTARRLMSAKQIPNI